MEWPYTLLYIVGAGTTLTISTMKTIFQIIFVIAALIPFTAEGQIVPKPTTKYVEKGKEALEEGVDRQKAANKEQMRSLLQSMEANDVFNRLEIAANAGTTGLGLEVASPITKWTKLRVGFDWMPRFCIPMKFDVNSYLDGKVNDKFDRIHELMEDLTGMQLDRTIKMESRPTLTTFKLLVDVYPFQDRHWHVTAGFFIGGNSFGKTINTMTEMPSLMCLNMYNRLYTNVMDDEFIDKISEEPIFGDIYLSPELAFELQDRLGKWGELGVHIGDFKDGTPYMMKPDKDGTVSAKAYVNRFRPYLGFGYGGALTADGKWQIGVEAGIQIWGGVPKVTTHEGVVLNDLKDLRDKVNSYMNLMKCMPVFPSLACRLSYEF